MRIVQQNEQLLIRSMELTELEYNNLVMDVAYNYLDVNLGKDIFGKEVLLNSRSFWTWWKIQWDRRNRIFINETRLMEVVAIIQPDARNLLRELYFETHSPAEINVYPSRLVMEMSYAQMIGNVFHEIQKGGTHESRS